MKTTFGFIIAAMAAIAVISSCQKELVKETANKTTDGVRTISVQFDNCTKASLSGFTPAFTNGDKIRVSNSEKSEERTVTVTGTAATFSTTLSGTLTAIYPADAAVLQSEAPDAPIANSDNFKVLATQDGTAAKAIIARADNITASSATFTGVTALFEITPPAGVKTFTITSLKPVEDGVARTGTAKAINTDGQTDDDKCVITVSNSDSTTFYVALVPGVNLSDLSFEYITDETHGAMKGITKNAITAASGTDRTAANTKYTINEQNWHPYVEIEMTVNSVSKTYKWATMNIGANDKTEVGKYFAWGDVKGQVPSSSTFDPGFSWDKCPYAVGGTYKFDKYVPAAKTSYLADGFPGDTKTVLDLTDDAANANWGGSWRMPTKEEFDALKSLQRGSFNSGYNFGTSDDAQIFLPAAGYGNGTGLTDAGSYGYYWSSSLRTILPSNAFYLYFHDGYADTYGDVRYYGQSVRALSE